MNLDCEVLVIGAGPTGLAVGCELRRRGTDVLVAEKAAGIDPRARAVMVHAGALEWLDGHGLRTRIESAGLRRDRIVFHVGTGTGAGAGTGTGESYTVDFTDLPTPHPYYVNVPQPEVERVLEEAYLGLGGRLLRGAAYTGHREEPGHLVAELAGPGQAGPVRVRARYLVGADGAGSTVRDRLGIAFPGTTHPAPYLLCEGTPGPATDVDPTGSAMFVGPAGAVSVLPLPGGRLRIAGPVTADVPDGDEALTLDAFRAAVDGLGFGDRLRMDTVERLARYRVHERLADRFRVGRALLAGDAAHLNPPAGGQAMNTGFADAADLAARLEDVLSGAPAGVLDGYEAVRRPAAARVARSTRVADLLQAMRDAATGTERAFVRGALSGLAREWSQLPAGAARREVAR
ncbi:MULTISPECIES: FAD-dependent monooxygenase [unclassified Nocardiopsis]|uniref:FAD-dependent monooxygenase n=1 Tax=Nocardiopsis TaxID=2013 RepID=UPI00387B606C